MAQSQGLPLSSPFRRFQAQVCRVRSAKFTEPMYVVPFGHRVVLVTSWDDVHTVVRVESVQSLCGLLGEASKTDQPRNSTSVPGDTDGDICVRCSGGADGKRTEGRWEPVLLEERVLLTDIKRLARKMRDLIADFESGDVSIGDQQDCALRFMDAGEKLMVHAAARTWLAENERLDS
jgi:hypothetical protein